MLVQAFRHWPHAYATQAQLWLQNYAEQLQAQFLLNTLLKVGGKTTTITAECWLQRWLNPHKTSPVASFVYRAWLDAQGKPQLVEQAIATWLADSSNATSREASFVFKAWLDAQGEPQLVEQAIATWLTDDSNATSPNAQFVFKAWLDAQGEPQLVEQAIAKWLADSSNATSREACFVFKAWGDRKKYLPEWMYKPAEVWFSNWSHSTEATYSVKYIAEIPDLSAATVHAIVEHCQRLDDAIDALDRLRRLSSQFGALAARGFLIATVADIAVRAVEQNRTARNVGAVLGGVLCVARICALPLRDEAARAAFPNLAKGACRLLRQADLTSGLSFSQWPINTVDMLIATNWEDLVKRALLVGEPKDAELHRGLLFWSDLCWPYANSTERAMYTRLRNLAADTGQPRSPG